MEERNSRAKHRVAHHERRTRVIMLVYGGLLVVCLLVTVALTVYRFVFPSPDHQNQWDVTTAFLMILSLTIVGQLTRELHRLDREELAEIDNEKLWHLIADFAASHPPATAKTLEKLILIGQATNEKRLEMIIGNSDSSSNEGIGLLRQSIRLLTKHG